jgi:hypothetical protein
VRANTAKHRLTRGSPLAQLERIFPYEAPHWPNKSEYSLTRPPIGPTRANIPLRGFPLAQLERIFPYEAPYWRRRRLVGRGRRKRRRELRRCSAPEVQRRRPIRRRRLLGSCRRRGLSTWCRWCV